MKRIAAVSLLALAGAGGAWWTFAPTTQTVLVGAPAPLPSHARTPATSSTPLHLAPVNANNVVSPPVQNGAASDAPPNAPLPDPPSRADATFQAVLTDMSSRVHAYATDAGLDEAGAQASADAIAAYLSESHNVHLAVRRGEMTRQAATAELADLHESLESDLRGRLGDDGYEGLRGAVPGKW